MKRPLMLFFSALVIFYSNVAQSASIDTHRVVTPYLYGEQPIRVLLPDSYDKSKSYRVLYVLPVSPGLEKESGSPLKELQDLNAHNLYDMIIVKMGFSKTPWFGDHASDPRVRQASYLKEFLAPFIESRYSTFKKPDGRLLLGFSKSGWGAFSLIMRYPDYFGYAAAWDAPLLLNCLCFNMEEIYGTKEQFDSYRPELLIRKQKYFFQEKTRLVLTGEKAWGRTIPAPGGGSHTQEAHKLLDENKVKHVYDGRVWAPHRWDKAWMFPTLEKLMRLTTVD